MDGSFVELKSGVNWNVEYVLNGLKYQTPCLFLIGGPRHGVAKFLEGLESQSRMLACERFRFDAGEWVLGLIAPLGSPQSSDTRQPLGASAGTAMSDEERYGGERDLARIADLIILESLEGITWTDLVNRLKPFADACRRIPWTRGYCRGHARFRAKEGRYRVEMDNDRVRFYLP